MTFTTTPPVYNTATWVIFPAAPRMYPARRLTASAGRAGESRPKHGDRIAVRRPKERLDEGSLEQP